MAMDVAEQVLVALRRILRASALQSKALAQRTGITTPQLLVLRALGTAGELTVSGISRAVNLSQATVTAIVDRLEKRTLVTRERSESDRRRVNVKLTPGAEELLASAPSPLQENFTSALSKLADWEQTQILSSLQRVASMMDASDIPAAPLLVGDTQLAGDPPQNQTVS